MATAVSLRKGTRDEHRRFKGDLGEVTFCTDENPTLFIHLGDEKPGSALAREDMENVSTEDIAKRGIAKLDLTNVTIPSTQIETVKGNLNNLNYAQRDMSDVNTLNLIKEGAHLGPDLARADGLTTFTTLLAEGTSADRDPNEYGKNLAYTDLDNVTTETVVGKLTVSGNHLYADRDLGNTNTANLATGAGTAGKHSGLNLAYANLSNLEILSQETKNTAHQYGIQLTDNLTQTINASSTTTEYPSAKTVYDAIEAIPKVPNFNQLGTEGYQVLVTSFLYNYQATKTADLGDGYRVNDLLTLIDNSGSSIGIEINILEIDDELVEGDILAYELLTTFGNTSINGTYSSYVNLFDFGANSENLPAPTADILGQVYTAMGAFKTSAAFDEGAGVNKPAHTMAKCVNTGTALSPVYKWKVVTAATGAPAGAKFQITSVSTGIQPGVTQITWMNLKNPITIRDTEMQDDTGIITVTFSRQPSFVEIKKLINGDIILGTWSPNGITMVFTPDVPADVLLDSWVIRVEG